jgi:hypothetical protein
MPTNLAKQVISEIKGTTRDVFATAFSGLTIISFYDISILEEGKIDKIPNPSLYDPEVEPIKYKLFLDESELDDKSVLDEVGKLVEIITSQGDDGSNKKMIQIKDNALLFPIPESDLLVVLEFDDNDFSSSQLMDIMDSFAEGKIEDLKTSKEDTEVRNTTVLNDENAGDEEEVGDIDFDDDDDFYGGDDDDDDDDDYLEEL